MNLGSIVAISENKKTTDHRDSTCEKFNKVECCFIGPMDVFKNQDGSAFLIIDLLQKLCEEGRPVINIRVHLRKIISHLKKNIVKGSEWPRREQCITCTYVNTRIIC